VTEGELGDKLVVWNRNVVWKWYWKREKCTCRRAALLLLAARWLAAAAAAAATATAAAWCEGWYR